MAAQGTRVVPGCEEAWWSEMRATVSCTVELRVEATGSQKVGT